MWAVFVIARISGATTCTYVISLHFSHPPSLATNQPTQGINELCSSFTSETASAAYAAAFFLMLSTCSCCLLICFRLRSDTSNDGSGSVKCCCCIIGFLLFLAALGLFAAFVAENILVFTDIDLAKGINCGGVIQPSLIAAILIDVSVGLIGLILFLFCCIKCCAAIENSCAE